MPRQLIPLAINDLSAFTRTLRHALQQQETVPTHATLLGLVAKAAGYENYQHLKAQNTTPPTSQATQSQGLKRALRVFENGVMTRWPKQTSVQAICMWVMWARLPAQTDLTETEVNTILMAHHSFGDHALLRRSLIDHRLVTRTNDGRIYRRIEQAPSDDGATIIAAQRPS